MDQKNYQTDINGQKVNKIVLDPTHDFSSLGLPDEALALLQNIKTVSSTPKKSEETTQSPLPQEAQELLGTMKEKERKDSSDKYKAITPNIPKLVFVDGKFVAPPDFLPPIHRKDINTKEETQEKENVYQPVIQNKELPKVETKKEEIPNISVVTPIAHEHEKATKIEEEKKESEPISLSSITNMVSLSDLVSNNNSNVSVSSTNNYTSKEKDQALVRGLTVHEEGMFLGIILGSTDKNTVINIMKDYSKVNYNLDCRDSILDYNDISVTIYFEDNIADMFEFGKKFKGHTSKGIAIGAKLEKAIELYGAPKMKSPKGAVWSGFKVFCLDGEITSIKVQKS